jgi:hypothetical protein
MRTSPRLTAAVLSTVLAASAPAADPPPELALIPSNAVAFAHVRLADLWKSNAFAEYRTAYQKAGPDVLAKLDAQFVPAPSTLDRVTVFVMPPVEGHGMVPVGVLRFSNAFDRKKVLAGLAPRAQPATAGNREYYVDAENQIAVYFPDDRTVLASGPSPVEAYLTLAPGQAGKLKDAAAVAGGGHLVTVAVDTERLPLPPDAVAQVPPPFRPLLKAGVMTLTAGGGDGRVRVRAEYATEADAKAAEKAARDGIGLARGFLVQGRREAEKGLAGPPAGGQPRPLDQLPEALGSAVSLGFLNILEEFLADPPIKRAGIALTLDTDIPTSLTRNLGAAPILVGLLLPAVQKVREAAARAQSSNNLKQIALAMHNYHDAYQRFPAAAIVDKSGKPLLSWRVAILPYVEQEALYKQFRLDEPWDSEHNKKLIPLMPKLYADPRLPPENGKTIYKVIVGKGGDLFTAFGPTEGRRLAAIPDGTANTVLAVAAGESVEWTKPEDIPYDPNGPLPDLSRPGPVLLAAFCDGSVRALGKIDENTLRAMITANGGEVFQLP